MRRRKISEKQLNRIIDRSFKRVINEIWDNGSSNESNEEILERYEDIIKKLIDVYDYNDGIIHSREVRELKADPNIYNQDFVDMINLLDEIDNKIYNLKYCHYVINIDYR